MKIFISGGCKNGKSSIAEERAMSLKGLGKLYYVATMIPHDEEDEERIANHRAERAGKGFTTIECGRNIFKIEADEDGTYLIDSVTALLSNEMFVTNDGENFEFDESAALRVANDLTSFANKVKNVVFVSDYIYSDIVYEELTEKYREGLATCDRALAKNCDVVCEVCLGNTFVYKGELV